MARPVHADAEATRRRILRAASTKFAQRGLHGTSIREVAREAEVSLAMVHHYFGSKRDLHQRCVEAMDEELATLQEELATVLTTGEPKQVLEQVVRRAFRFAREHQLALRMVMRRIVDTGELESSRMSEIQLPFLERGSTLLSGLLGRPAEDLRLTMMSVVFLITRYAVAGEGDIAVTAGVDRSESVSAAEDHLVRAAHALFGV